MSMFNFVTNPPQEISMAPNSAGPGSLGVYVNNGNVVHVGDQNIQGNSATFTVTGSGHLDIGTLTFGSSPAASSTMPTGGGAHLGPFNANMGLPPLPSQSGTD